MEKYYRLIKQDRFNYGNFTRLQMRYLELPWCGFKNRGYLRYKDSYHFFTEKWFKQYIQHHLKEGQTVTILYTNIEPTYIDGQQATFDYPYISENNIINSFTIGSNDIDWRGFDE